VQIIPAIDIKAGKVVRLVQGDMMFVTSYSDSPLKMAEHWASYGVSMLHVVDLDGAILGDPVNLRIASRIARAVKAKIEFGGGVRDLETVKKVLGSGIDKVVVGTKALDKKFLRKAVTEFGDRIVVGIDAKRSFVYTGGWLVKTRRKAVDLAGDMEKAGVATINYTDISKDGMLEGPNIQSIRELVRNTKVKVVASGGVSCIGDLKKLKELEKDGLAGVIIGKALYEHTVDLKEAMRVGAAVGT
jgi:phosphoribosylformimino-5-aminoimidazole carboxamide ribotide isomerase